MKIKILIILICAFLFSFNFALAIGIGAKPSSLDLELNLGQPKKNEILVYNLSREAGIFQVSPDELEDWIKIEPNNFKLEAGENKKIKITVLAKEEGRKATNLSISASPLDRRSFGVSPGLKIPLRLNVEKEKPVFLASLLNTISHNWILIAGILGILLIGVFLARYLKRRKFNMKISLKILIPIFVLIIGFFLGQYLAKIEILPTEIFPEVEVEKEIKASLLLDFGEGNIKNFENIQLEKEKTVFNLLKKVTKANNLELSYKEYPGMGVFIESIDNIKNDPQKNKFWQYWVNGKYAQVGASKFILKEGDFVEWKYVESQF